jgi:SAM-dependent methyltransferase
MKDAAMDIHFIHRINELWQPVYPFLGEWMQPWCPEKTGRILELGPFSGGISTSLLHRNPRLTAYCVFWQKGLIRSLEKLFHPGISLILGNAETLPFRSSFDLIISRGAFFFLTPKMIQSIYGTLKPGGIALLGGGYGPLTPKEAIDPIAVESKELNYRLGKQLMSLEVLERILREARMESHSRILEEGGLWMFLKKETNSATKKRRRKEDIICP